MSEMKRQGELREGLVQVVRERAERLDADVIMQALTVCGGAQAIGLPSPCEPRPEEP